MLLETQTPARPVHEVKLRIPERYPKDPHNQQASKDLVLEENGRSCSSPLRSALLVVVGDHLENLDTVESINVDQSELRRHEH